MIPSFNTDGLLPPYLSGDPTLIQNMSPYATSLSEMVARLATSNERAEILKGLIRYREELSGLGFADGFHWLNGSFSEDVEKTESRPPRDIDVVSFLRRPAGIVDDAAWRALLSSHPHIFNPTQAKATFQCDAYLVDLSLDQEFIVNLSRYWFGLFSHKRVYGTWKGMLRVEFASDDSAAKTELYRRFP